MFVFVYCFLQSDLTRGQTGLNSFYKMQIIHSSDSSYTLFRKWGRVGQDGSTTELEYLSYFFSFFPIFYAVSLLSPHLSLSQSPLSLSTLLMLILDPLSDITVRKMQWMNSSECMYSQMGREEQAER